MGREIQWDVLKQPDFEKRKQKEERKEKRRQRMSEIWAGVGYFLVTFAIFCMISLTIDLVKWVMVHWADVAALAMVAGVLVLVYLIYRPGAPNSRGVKTGRDYEHWCAKYLLRHGFRSVHVTPESQDYGADIVARDRRWRLWVVQCKFYSRNVGVSAVQEVVAARAHYGADYAAVMTNAGFTQNAVRLAEENGVKLWSNCI